MPVELIIGGIGLASLLSLFQTCNRAYDFFIRSANDIGKDAHLLGVHLEVDLEVERRRLQLWGRHLGISQAQGCQLLLRESYETQKFVVARLDAIKLLLDDIDVIFFGTGSEFARLVRIQPQIL